MKLTKLTALAAGMGLAAIAGTASAFSLGEVWVGDQNTGELYIFDQGELNDASFDAVETTLDLTAIGTGSTRMHLIGFTNHNGLDPMSRAQLAYLNGSMVIMATNGGSHAPTEVQTIQVSSDGDGGGSLHMCGGNPQNTELTCSSIGQKQLISEHQESPIHHHKPYTLKTHFQFGYI